MNPHPNGCDCAECANAHVIAHEFLTDLDAGLIQAGPFGGQPPQPSTEDSVPETQQRDSTYQGLEYSDRDGHGWRPLSDEPQLWWAPQHPIPLTLDELREQRGPLAEVQR